VQASSRRHRLGPERASDGARASIELAGAAARPLGRRRDRGHVTAISTGWVLSPASEAIAFIPNQIGAALSLQREITR
jgi:hypothetical protein